jgi:hypothetical protein
MFLETSHSSIETLSRAPSSAGMQNTAKRENCVETDYASIHLEQIINDDGM